MSKSHLILGPQIFVSPCHLHENGFALALLFNIKTLFYIAATYICFYPNLNSYSCMLINGCRQAVKFLCVVGYELCLKTGDILHRCIFDTD
jgi:hypothetical protein